jgi:competence protein ComFC
MSLVMSTSVECPEPTRKLTMHRPRFIDRAVLTLHHGLWQAVDLLLPPACIQCGKEGERWCLECQASIERVGQRVCRKCGKRLQKGRQCKECALHPPRYTALRSYGIYRDPLRKAILRAKYHRDLALGEILTGLMVQLVNEQGWEIDLIIPVPISPSKLGERGYNQVDLFARPLAWRLGLPYINQALTRAHEDTSQVKLTAADRRLNVAHAFQLDRSDPIHGKRILLVDDVATTGSTAEVCSGLLLDAGAELVFVATLARSLLRRSSQEVI